MPLGQLWSEGFPHLLQPVVTQAQAYETAAWLYTLTLAHQLRLLATDAHPRNYPPAVMVILAALLCVPPGSPVILILLLLDAGLGVPGQPLLCLDLFSQVRCTQKALQVLQQLQRLLNVDRLSTLGNDVTVDGLGVDAQWQEEGVQLCLSSQEGHRVTQQRVCDSAHTWYDARLQICREPGSRTPIGTP